MAIPKSAAASLEALASFALDGCEEPLESGENHDMASTAVKNPFGGGDVKVRFNRAGDGCALTLDFTNAA